MEHGPPGNGSRVGPGYNFPPASPPTYTVGKIGGRTSGHPSGGTHYLPAQVEQSAGVNTKNHPGWHCIKKHVHMSATCP